METVIKAVKEFSESREVSSEDYQNHMENLKPEINNLLHTFLPDNLTLKEVDILAMVINDMIWNPKKYLKQEEE